MDANGAVLLMSSIGTGIAVGISTLSFALFSLLPASYMMNKYVYHTPPMRAIIGILAGMGSMVTFAIILIGCLSDKFPKVHYFGLLPTFATSGDSQPSGWFAIVFKIWNYIRHPFLMYFNQEAFEKSIESMLIANVEDNKLEPAYNGKCSLKGAVCEDFFEDARNAGKKDNNNWESDMKKLESFGTALFTSGPGVTVEALRKMKKAPAPATAPAPA